MEHRHFPVTFTRREQKETERSKKTCHSGSVNRFNLALGLFVPVDEGIAISGKWELKKLLQGLFRQIDDRPPRDGIPACTTTICPDDKPLEPYTMGQLAAIRRRISGFIYFFYEDGWLKGHEQHAGA